MRKLWGLSCASLSILVLLAGDAQGYWSQTLREDSEEAAPYFKGFLTWTDRPGMAWSAEAHTTDPGGPGPTDSQALLQGSNANVGWNLKSNTGDDHGMIPVDVFRSEPLPTALHVNASRYIKLDLYLLTAECRDKNLPPHLDVELYLGDTFLGGQVHGPAAASSLPTFMEGHCAHYYRFQPELDLLPQGGVLTLKVLHHSQLLPFQYGLGGNHWSNLRIPTYTPAEATQRVLGVAPEKLPAAAPVDPAQSGGAPQDSESETVVEASSTPSPAALVSGLGILGGAGLAFPGIRRRAAALLVVGAFVLLALAGCLGDGGLAGAKGVPATILGRVLDEQEFPIPGAHVTLLGDLTFNATYTDHQGNFTFENLTAGKYRILVDKKGLLPLDEEVDLRPAQVVEYQAVMLLPANKGSGFRRHGHDMWGDRQAIEILNEAVPVHQQTRGCLGTGVASLSSDHCIFSFALKDWTILPGTSDIEVAVSWSAENSIERVGFAFEDNQESGYRTYMYPRGNGASVHVRAAWEMTDAGHQAWTTWKFYLWIPTNGGDDLYSLPVTSLTQSITRPLNVKMVLHKGVVPVDPPHPDFWGENITLPVPMGRNVTIGCDAPCNVYLPNGYNAKWEPRTLIPAETRWLEISLQWSRESSVEWTLVYRPADIAPNEDGYYDEEEYKKVPAGQREALQANWSLALEDDEPDPFYAKKSYWLFLLDDGKETYSTIQRTSFALTIIAHKDAPPKE